MISMCRTHRSHCCGLNETVHAYPPIKLVSSPMDRISWQKGKNKQKKLNTATPTHCAATLEDLGTRLPMIKQHFKTHIKCHGGSDGMHLRIPSCSYLKKLLLQAQLCAHEPRCSRNCMSHDTHDLSYPHACLHVHQIIDFVLCSNGRMMASISSWQSS